MARPYAEQIDDILERCNFARVQRLMAAEGLCWGGSNVPPTKQEIREAAACVLNAAVETQPAERVYLFEGGGFVVLRRDGVLHLWFAATGWDGQ